MKWFGNTKFNKDGNIIKLQYIKFILDFKLYLLFQIIFGRGPWLQIKSHQNDPLLREDVQRIPDIVKSARSKNTNKKYDGYFMRPRATFLEALEGIGEDKRLFGLHSLRRV